MNTMLPIRIAAPALLALLLSACAATTPRSDERFGESVRATLASQIASPAAVCNPNAASGIDGRAARAGQERYEHSFAKAEAAAQSTLVGAK
jgi:type IV pilus biogenesis protein CpaD/CtpE